MFSLGAVSSASLQSVVELFARLQILGMKLCAADEFGDLEGAGVRVAASPLRSVVALPRSPAPSHGPRDHVASGGALQSNSLWIIRSGFDIHRYFKPPNDDAKSLSSLTTTKTGFKLDPCWYNNVKSVLLSFEDVFLWGILSLPLTYTIPLFTPPPPQFS